MLYHVSAVLHFLVREVQQTMKPDVCVKDWVKSMKIDKEMVSVYVRPSIQ